MVKLLLQSLQVLPFFRAEFIAFVASLPPVTLPFSNRLTSISVIRPEADLLHRRIPATRGLQSVFAVLRIFRKMTRASFQARASVWGGLRLNIPCNNPQVCHGDVLTGDAP
jgi:hypothetical protein